MEQTDEERWDAKHAARKDDPLELSSFLIPCLAGMQACRALDLACGRGRHAAILARMGFTVLGVDVSGEALRQVEAMAKDMCLPIDTERLDLAAGEFPTGQFGLVVCTMYLERSLFPRIREAIEPGGHLLLETYRLEQVERSGGSFPAEWCLRPGELREAFSGWEVLEDFDREEGEAPLHSFHARKPVS
jgi:tellurite methyltransferase